MHLTITYIQTYFPLYLKYFLNTLDEYSDEVLTSELELAEIEAGEYIELTDPVPDQLKRHILNIVKYRGFCRLHGDTQFETKPQIVKDYESTIATLRDIRDSKSGLTGQTTASPGVISITANQRLFGETGSFDDKYIPGPDPNY